MPRHRGISEVETDGTIQGVEVGFATARVDELRRDLRQLAAELYGAIEEERRAVARELREHPPEGAGGACRND